MLIIVVWGDIMEGLDYKLIGKDREEMLYC
jgi:hypothetical protein